jgi:hypothetical protein
MPDFADEPAATACARFVKSTREFFVVCRPGT